MRDIATPQGLAAGISTISLGKQGGIAVGINAFSFVGVGSAREVRSRLSGRHALCWQYRQFVGPVDGKIAAKESAFGKRIAHGYFVLSAATLGRY